MTRRMERPWPEPAPVEGPARTAWAELATVLDRLQSSGRRTPCQVEPHAFTGDDRHDRAEAATACAWCPARDPCGRFAVANGETFHTWGGTDRTHHDTDEETAR